MIILKRFFFITCLLLFLGNIQAIAQLPLYEQVLVSDEGFNNSIGAANTSRNVGVDEQGNIYVAYSSTSGIRVAKSVDRGQSFLPSVVVNTSNSFPEIVVDDGGTVYIAWIANGNIYFSKSTDGGNTFSAESIVGDGGGRSPHMAVYENNVYIVDQIGEYTYSNNTNGIGAFKTEVMPKIDVYADVRTDKNGVVYVPSDDPTLYLSKSINEGLDFDTVALSSVGQVFYSSYALSDGPAGTFIFVGGDGTTGYKIDVSTGVGAFINLGDNSNNLEGRTLFADSFGALIDGFLNEDGILVFNVSYDQGETFPLSVDVAPGESHNIDRNPKYDDVNVVYEQNGQVYMNVYDGILRGVRIPDSSNQLELCQGGLFELPYVLSGNFGPDSEFAVYLSDEEGSFENTTFLGKIISNIDGQIEIMVPVGIPDGENYRIQIQSLANFVQSNIIEVSIGGAIVIEATKPDDLILCEESEGKASFDLESQDDIIKDVNSTTIITYHTTEEDAENNTNAIADFNNYLSESTTIWARKATDSSSLCIAFDVVNFELIVDSTINSIVAVKPNDLVLCEESEGKASFDLESQDEIIKDVNLTTIITYHTTEEDAENNTNAIVDFNNYLSESDTIWARKTTDPSSLCLSFDVVSFELIVNAVVAVKPSDLVLCEESEGKASFDLETQDDLIKDVNLTTVITYHTTEEDAENNTNAIVDFNNYLSESATVWARKTIDSSSPCVAFDVVSFELIVNLFNLSEPSVLSSCGNSLDFNYDLTIKEDEISTDQNIVFSYFESTQNLDLNIKISNPENYTSNSLETTIIVLVENDEGCTNTTNLELIVVENEVFNESPNSLEECDIDNDGFTQFNLTETEVDILDGLMPETDYVFEYYEVENDANQANESKILDILNFSNTIQNSQTIYVNVKNRTGECFTVIPLEIIAKSNPQVSLEENYVLCLDSSDMSISDLESNSTTSLPIDTKLDATDYSFQWYSGNDINADNLISGQTLSTFSPVEAGIYSVEVLDKNTECTTVASTTVTGSYPPVSVTTSIISLPFSGNNKIEVFVEGKGEYEYKIDEDGVWQSNSILTRVSEGEHTIFVRDLFACDTLSDVEVIIDFPRFFTPNEDGVNDFWAIENVGVPGSTVVFIYDRFGKLLEQLRSDSIGWSGLYNGKPVPSDDYWFLLEFKDEITETEQQVKGHFSLIR